MDQTTKEKLFLDLLKQHKNQVYRVCWGFTNNQEEINDLFQESMMRIWNGLSGFKSKSTISTWIYRITVNTCIYWQKQKRKFPLVHSEYEPKKQEAFVMPFEDTIIQNENIARLKKAIQSLTKIDRTLILLLLENCTYKDIAEITGMTTNHVGVKINRIKKELKKLMEVENI